MGAEDDELDELRRRLYGPDATAADREAFRVAEAAREAARVAAPAAPSPVAPRVEPQSPAPPGPRGRWRVAALAGAAVLVLAGATAVAIGHPFATPRPTSATPSPTTSVIGSIPVTAAVRARFLGALRAGRDPGLEAYVLDHPDVLLTSLRARGRLDTTGATGEGPTTLNLAPSIPARSGHVTLVLVAEQDVHFEWTPTTVADANDRSGPEVPVATDDGAAVAGQPVVGTVAFSGGVPSRLTLLLPAGVHWGAVVIYTR